MSIKTKIQQGTGRLTGKPLCFSCRHGVQRGKTLSCAYYGELHEVREQIFECNVYVNSSLTSLSDMKEVAWELKTTGVGGGLGSTRRRRTMSLGLMRTRAFRSPDTF